MIILGSLKHNKFEQIDIPKGADLFARVGQRVAPLSQYSGEDVLSPSVSKIDAVKSVINEDVEPVNEQ